MKISLITACYNSAKTIKTAMESVFSQKGVEVEYIVVDGGSTDGTLSLLHEYQEKMGNGERGTGNGERGTGNGERGMGNGEDGDRRSVVEFKWLSEPDSGMYDAINKGIKMATGDIVGILNADDVLASDNTLSKIAAAFDQANDASVPQRIDALYADIRFVNDGDTVEAMREAKTVRYCSAKRWRPWMFRFAAMVPHPSFYVRRECFDRLGMYSLDYRICADFELELRFLGIAGLTSAYLPECVVVMRMGGASTAGWRANVEINREDLRALRANGVWSCLPMLYLKYFFKIWGFVLKRGT